MSREKVTDETGQCYRCKQLTELARNDDMPEWVEDAYWAYYEAGGLDVRKLKIPYGMVCYDCLEAIREEWSETGDLTKPVTSWGAKADA